MEGYLVVSAQDPSEFNVAWAHDYLIGSELIVNRSGGMYGLNAIPFEARVDAGDETDVNGNGKLDFDDAEYEGIPDLLYIDSCISELDTTCKRRRCHARLHHRRWRPYELRRRPPRLGEHRQAAERQLLVLA